MKRNFVKKIPKEKINELREKIKDSFSTIFSETPPTNEYELSRFKSDKGILVIYKSGKVVLIHENLDNVEDFLISFIPEEKFDVLIGVDETGKGELFGGIIVCGVKIEKNFREIEKLISHLNTKTTNNYNIYKTVFQKLTELEVKYAVEEILPTHLKEKSTNTLLANAYSNIISALYPREPKNIRIVLDDFGIPREVKEKIFSTYPEAKIIIEPKADDNYLECKTASIISKYFRKEFLNIINKKYQIEDLSPNDGNLAKPETLKWLKKWIETYKRMPPFVKSWKKVIDKLNLKI